MKHTLNSIRSAVLIIWRPLLGAVLSGVVTGLIGALLWNALDWSTDFFSAHSWVVWLLPAGGMLIAVMYRAAPRVGDTNQVLESVRGEGAISPLMAPLICCSTFLTRVFGGSVGSEGAAIQMGGSTASTIGKWLKTDGEQLRILIMSGISGGFASVVGTPVTAIMLAIELTGPGVMLYEAVLPCAVASTVSYSIAAGTGVSFPRIALESITGNGFIVALQVAVLAAVCGLASILLCKSIRYSAVLYRKIFASPILRAAAGGLLIALLSTAVHTSSFNGGGLNLLAEAAAGHARPADFLLKIVFTALTIGAGFRGGAIVPTVAVGASLGGFAGPLIGLSPALGAGVGMTSLFCGAINCPMTAFVLGLETFGMNANLYFILACAVGYVCSGYSSLYPAQIIHRSKVSGRIINRRAS